MNKIAGVEGLEDRSFTYDQHNLYFITFSLPTVTSQCSKLKHLGNAKNPFVTCKRDLWIAKKMHMCRAPVGTLHSQVFKVVMGLLLLGFKDRFVS